MKEFDSLYHRIIKKGEIGNSKLDETLLSLEKGKTYYYALKQLQHKHEPLNKMPIQMAKKYTRAYNNFHILLKQLKEIKHP